MAVKTNLTDPVQPIRCFSCGKVLAGWSRWETEMSGGVNQGPLLDSIGAKRDCCRRMYLGHPTRPRPTVHLRPRRKALTAEQLKERGSWRTPADVEACRERNKEPVMKLRDLSALAAGTS